VQPKKASCLRTGAPGSCKQGQPRREGSGCIALPPLAGWVLQHERLKRFAAWWQVVADALKLGGKFETGRRGKTPLMGAIRTNNVEAVKLLLAAGADANKETDAGLSPLWVAARDGNTEVSTVQRAQTQRQG
jgi:hypothetical protein